MRPLVMLLIGAWAGLGFARVMSPPDLDELLGLPPERSTRGGASGEVLPEAQDPSRAQLERRLAAEQANERFREAVQLMGESARRLGDARDVGIRTQRLQQEILTKLDQVIASAQQGGGSSSSSSSSQPPQQPQRQPNQASAGQQHGDGERADMGPQHRDGPLNPELATSHAAWGALPDRVRDALVQGTNDPFSTMYRALTEAYYRRLAEERPR
ncbi:MAG: hypothetical protein KIT24_05590 [Phycisphaeraceae bacterium]|nr:hypothetical protein [Phycisphaeraceae bacterium]